MDLFVEQRNDDRVMCDRQAFGEKDFVVRVEI